MLDAPGLECDVATPGSREGAMGVVMIVLGGLLVVATGTGWLTRAEQGLRAPPHRYRAAARGLSHRAGWLPTPAERTRPESQPAAGRDRVVRDGPSFVRLLGHLGADVAPLQAFSAFALAVLAGAASMLPGGVGSTELAIVAPISRLGVPVETAALAAVRIPGVPPGASSCRTRSPPAPLQGRRHPRDRRRARARSMLGIHGTGH
jgi:hypothetical protein